jgi:hypothetical protein
MIDKKNPPFFKGGDYPNLTIGDVIDDIEKLK